MANESCRSPIMDQTVSIPMSSRGNRRPFSTANLIDLINGVRRRRESRSFRCWFLLRRLCFQTCMIITTLINSRSTRTSRAWHHHYQQLGLLHTHLVSMKEKSSAREEKRKPHKKKTVIPRRHLHLHLHRLLILSRSLHTE